MKRWLPKSTFDLDAEMNRCGLDEECGQAGNVE